jgi:hypothetical protein
MSSTRRNLILKSLVLTFSLSFLYGCSLKVFTTPRPENIDKSFLIGESCTLPCWHGLIINKSTKDDFIATLDNLPFVEHNTYKEYSTIWVNDLPATEIQFTCASNHTSTCGGALISDNTLRSVWTVLEYDLTIKDAVEKLGSPEFVEYEWPSISGKCSFSLVWAAHGVSASIYDDRSYNECESIIDGNRVLPTLFVNSITYFSFDDYGELGDC